MNGVTEPDYLAQNVPSFRLAEILRSAARKTNLITARMLAKTIRYPYVLLQRYVKKGNDAKNLAIPLAFSSLPKRTRSK